MSYVDITVDQIRAALKVAEEHQVKKVTIDQISGRIEITFPSPDRGPYWLAVYRLSKRGNAVRGRDI